MDFPQIKLSTQQAKIDINVTKGQFMIEQKKADIQIEQPQAKLEIRQQPARLTIDQTKAWDNIDLKGILKRSKEYADHANQVWLRDLAIMSQQGDQLMRISEGGNPIAQQAKANSKLEFNITVGGAPAYDLVDINFDPVEPEITVTKNDPTIHVKENKPHFDFRQGSVDITMEKYAKVDTDFENLKFKGYRFETNI